MAPGEVRAPGVALTPPPPGIRASLDKQIALLIAELPAEKKGAVVTLVTTTGVNLAVIARVNKLWTVKAWVGKSWGGPVDGAGEVAASW